jgi:hypothetical protein
VSQLFWHRPIFDSCLFTMSDMLNPCFLPGPSSVLFTYLVLVDVQAYEAEFKIQHTVYNRNPSKFVDIGDYKTRQGMVIADIALTMLILDIKKLVQAGVLADIDSRTASATNAIAARESAKARRTHLRVWMEQKKPLDYEGVAFVNLVRAVVADEDAIHLGLPDSYSRLLSFDDLAQSLYSIGKQTNPTRAQAPILSTGSFLPVLRVAIKHLMLLAPTTIPAQVWTKNILKRTATHLCIRYVPWTKTKEGPGAPNRTPVWDSWVRYGLSDNVRTVMPAGSLNAAELAARHAASALEEASTSDGNAPWTCAEFTLQTIGTNLNKSVLPTEFTIPTSGEPYVIDTYTWVRDHYNPRQPLHQYALFVAIMVSRALPALFCPGDNPQSLFKDADTPAKTARIARAIPWVSKVGKKGVLRPAPFIGMVTTFIIAIYSKDSPLRIRMAGNGGNIGEGWTSKHGTFAVIGTSDSRSLVPRCEGTHRFHFGSNGSCLGERTKGCAFGPFRGTLGNPQQFRGEGET